MKSLVVVALILAGGLFPSIAVADRIDSMQPTERCVYKARLSTLVANQMIVEKKGEIRFVFKEDPEPSELEWLAAVVESVARAVAGGEVNPLKVGDAAYAACMSERDSLRQVQHFRRVADLDCGTLAFDLKKIGRAVYDGAPKEGLKQHAINSPELGEARLKVILDLIDDAYAHEGEIIDWIRARYRMCQE
jgi:hypothetical protein